jgi:hypothetical protein
MKRVIPITKMLLIILTTVLSCTDDSNNELDKTANNPPIDLCKCLTEPGNTEWSIENRDACRDAISKELNVANWEKVNFSKEPALNRKWEELAEKCTGTKEVKTGVESIDKNSSLLQKIGSRYGYVWESVNTEAQIYTTLAFDALRFRTTAYSMNNKTNSEDFIKLMDLSGKWTAVDNENAAGIIEQNDISVNWKFDPDYTTLINNKGVIFKRIKVE